MSKYKNQHFVPRAYLKNFIASYPQNPENKSMLWVLDKENQEIQDKSIKRICSRKYLYSHLASNGQYDHSVEIYLNRKIEDKYEILYQEITNIVDNLTVGNDKLSLTEESLQTLYKFIWMQKLRVPKFFEDLSRDVRYRFRALNELYNISESTEKINNDVKKEVFNEFLNVSNDSFQKVLSILKSKGILITVVPNGLPAKFISSDNPVITINPYCPSALINPYTEISLPISGNIAISLSGSISGFLYRYIDSEEEIRRINREIAINAERFVISGNESELNCLLKL